VTGCPWGEVAAPSRPTDPSGLRSYEVYQRLRVHEASPVIRPRQLWSAEFRDDPWPVLHAVREHTPCYRDWIGNAFWVTRYDDVTSVFVDDANFETRTRRWSMELAHRGRDRRHEIPVTGAETRRIDGAVEAVTARVLDAVDRTRPVDLVREVLAPIAYDLVAEAADIPAVDRSWFVRTLLRVGRGTAWDPRWLDDARQAFDDLSRYAQELLEARRHGDGDDVVCAIARQAAREAPATGDDVAATWCETDHDTLVGSLANLWSLLLAHPDELARLGDDRRLWKLAWLEALRHSPPLMTASRWTRHEVERFGMLIPAGALVLCSVGAANRDPRQFADPDEFRPGRKDLCQREARGQYRADGLASTISPGTGAPSRFPAVPEDRPRSRFALVRDTAVTVSRQVWSWAGSLSSTVQPVPGPRAVTDGGVRMCWSLPVHVGERGAR